MGVTHVTTTVWNLPREGNPFEAEFMVDAGAVDCLAPRDALLAAGISPKALVGVIRIIRDGQPNGWSNIREDSIAQSVGDVSLLAVHATAQR